LGSFGSTEWRNESHASYRAAKLLDINAVNLSADKLEYYGGVAG